MLQSGQKDGYLNQPFRKNEDSHFHEFSNLGTQMYVVKENWGEGQSTKFLKKILKLRKKLFSASTAEWPY